MRWTVGSKIGAVLALMLIVFIAAGAVSYRSTDRVIAATDERQSAYDANAAGDAVRLALRRVGIQMRNYVLSGDPQHLATYRAALDAAIGGDGPLQRLSALAASADEARRAEQLRTLFLRYRDATGAIVDLRAAKGQPEAAALLFSADTQRLFGAVEAALDQMDQQQDKGLTQATAYALREGRNALLATVLGTVLGLAVAAGAGWALTRHIAGPLQRLTHVTERIAIGDLALQPETSGRRDEIGVLTNSLARVLRFLQEIMATAASISAGDLRANVSPQSDADQLGRSFVQMSTNLRTQIGELIASTKLLAASSSSIVASSAQLAANASQTAAAVAETTATVEEVRQTAELATQKARLVSDNAQKAVQTSAAGRKSTQDVEAGMRRIRQQMELLGQSMLRLSEQNHAIGQVIAIVEDVATQSNLLAVNAAIEAAKAGEHGRGFAVVAQEVRSLAEQSRQATVQVRGLLGDIQKATSGAIVATEEGGRAVDAGIQQTEVAATVIQQLARNVDEAAQAATQIAASSQQQLAGMDQVAGAMDSIRQASEQNVDSATQLETTARSLDQLGRSLTQLVDRYRV